MNENDKELYELAKIKLEITNLEQLALLLGYAKTTVNNWYKSGFNDIVKFKILDAIDKHSKNTSKSLHTIIGNGNISFSGNNNDVSGNTTGVSSQTTNYSDDIKEISDLLQEYGSPKMIKELKDRLLQIKALHG